jgi:hypothetical protein
MSPVANRRAMRTLRSSVWYSSLAFGAAALFTAVASAQTAAVLHPHVWQRWENALRSTRQYRHEPHKPVINLEAMYDGQGENGWQAVDARSLAWRSWLSGAKGYAYGAGDTPPKCLQGSGGLWKWVTDPQKYDFWEKALQWESAFQMQYLHDFLAAIEWWQLEPAHELICNQPDDVTRRMVLAKLPGRDFAVAYLPGNDGIEVNLSAFSSPLVARWFDPVRGHNTLVPGSIKNQGVHRFRPPAKGDWVLVASGSGEFSISQ